MTQEKETNRQAEQGKAETEIPCAVCRDLIPLVQDGVASPESEALVKAHLQACPHPMMPACCKRSAINTIPAC